MRSTARFCRGEHYSNNTDDGLWRMSVESGRRVRHPVNARCAQNTGRLRGWGCFPMGMTLATILHLRDVQAHAQQAFAFSKNDKNYEEPESQYWSICSLPVVTAHWAVASGVWTPILPCLIVVGAEKTL